MSGLHLGYVDQAPTWTLVSHLFPDKIGGRPAWLALKNLPSIDELQCPSCHQPMVFLLQLYSPLDERNDCFHRVIFVFMCKSGSCYSLTSTATPFRAFRSQLPRENAYYSSNPPVENGLTLEKILTSFRNVEFPTAGKFVNLCPICGCRGSKFCAACKNVAYCSKDHQTVHWRQFHRDKCPSFDSIEEMFSENIFLLPEFSVLSESVTEDISQVFDSENDSEPDVPSQYTDSVEQEECKALEEIARQETKDERIFNEFKEMMKFYPDQVVRFNRGGSPLWSSSNRPSIPQCKLCGGSRVFEFQITPQILSYLNLDRVGAVSPDFASVYVFTCENSCPSSPANSASDSLCSTDSTEYVEEFVHYDRVP